MKAKDSSVKLVASAAIGVAMAFGVQADSKYAYTIESGDVVTLTNKIATMPGGSTIYLKPGVYNLSQVGSTNVSNYGRSHLYILSGQINLRGTNDKHWSKKTRDEETILLGDGTAAIVAPYGGTPRKSSFFNITFENGCYTEGVNGGGGICCSASEQWRTNGVLQVATNCVFRNCSNSCKSSKGGGGSCDIYAIDCCYTNCVAPKGGGAYGECNNNSQKDKDGKLILDFFQTNFFVNCVFVDCTATNGNGGAIYTRENDHIIGCTFKNCRATKSGEFYGGGVFFNTGTKLVDGCTFTDCVAQRGAGMAFSTNNVVVITNCTFKNNRAASGGGMYFTGNCPVGKIVDCTFTDLVATNGYGGGIVSFAVCTNLVGCTFSGCSAGQQGGGVYLSKDGSRIDGCTFTNCTTTSNGGGVCALRGISSVVNSSFRNCYGTYGGALCTGAGYDFGVATNCVFADNNANICSGVYAYKTSGSLVNCVFSNNTNTNIKAIGSHVNGVESVIGCTFTGWGGMVACQYDRCKFDGCRYFANDANSWYDGMVVFNVGRLTSSKDWYLRNCLFTGCDTSVITLNDSCRQLTIDNCTFVSNSLSTFGNHEGYISHVMRAKPAGSNQVIGGTNVFNNCIFWENSNKTATGTKYRHDARFYGTNTGVSNKLYAVTAITNCIYGGTSTPTYGGSTIHYESNFDKVADVKFVGGNSPQRYVGRPFYSLRAGSPARERGTWLDWMDAASSTDISGNPRIVGKLPDIGCYEYQPFNLGMIMLVQ